VFPTSFAGVIEALRFGHAQAAFMSAWPLALAKRIAQAETVLAEVREVYIDSERVEAPFYYSYWITMPDSPYQTLEELRGRRAAFPSQLSTSGYVAPMARMVELGLLQRQGNNEVNPRNFFSEVLFAGGYGQAWEALRTGRVDVAIIAGDVSASLYAEVIASTRALESQGPIPSHGVAFARQLTGNTRNRLRDALLKLGTDENRELMRKFISGIFIRFQETTTEQHIGSLARYLELTGLGFTETLR
jgi:phosphonate transport system substrate-binding protein